MAKLLLKELIDRLRGYFRESGKKVAKYSRQKHMRRNKKISDIEDAGGS